MTRVSLASTLAFATSLLLAGCGGGKQDEFKPLENQPEQVEMEDHHHDEGPHGGHIIDLGDHEYRAELTMDEQSRQVTVYLLEHDTDDPVAIEDESITLNLRAGDQPTQVALQPAPQEGDPEGKASRFQAPGDQIPEQIKDIEELEGELSVKIGEKSYTGEIEHDHDH